MNLIGVSLLFLWLSSALLLGVKCASQEEEIAKCEAYKPLYANIHEDLSRWRSGGVSLELIQATIKDHASRRRAPHNQKGFAAAFRNGSAFLLGAPELSSWTGHHASIWFIYMQHLLVLQEKFGRLIPDVDFVISSLDRPLQVALNSSTPPQPVFRFCKTDSHADVLIPDFHFFMKDYVPTLLKKIDWINNKYPWNDKKPAVFGRFTLYDRHLHPLDKAAYRVGSGNQSICTSASLNTHTIMCRVRAHFVEWAKSMGPDMDVDHQGRVPMHHHAGYKYLVHLDGQGLSSRLEQLLTMGSLVFKEQSGYRAFFHRLLQPHKHYIPFWKGGGPEDILEGLQWAKANDDKAAEIAKAGQQFAKRYFNSQALDCYWYTLLVEFSKLLRYEPKQMENSKYMRVYMSVEKYIDTVAMTYSKGYWFDAFKFESFDPKSM